MIHSEGDLMNLLKNKLYQEDLDYITSLDLPWNSLQNKTVLISGASGMIASCLIDVVMKLRGGGTMQSNFPWT